MTRLRLRTRAPTRRLTFIDTYQFPTGVRQRFAHQHETLSADDVRAVETAMRQWFRLAARHPRTTLSMPSLVADHMWHELVLHTRDYAEFCEAAFGRFLHHTPEPAMNAKAATDNRSTDLARTFRLAQQDADHATGQLPLLFRLDMELGISGGARYLADCGGRGQCHHLQGSVCLRHLGGAGRPRRGFWDRSLSKHGTDTGPVMHGGSGGLCGGSYGGGG
jgi:hypothetical protein